VTFNLGAAHSLLREYKIKNTCDYLTGFSLLNIARLTGWLSEYISGKLMDITRHRITNLDIRFTIQIYRLALDEPNFRAQKNRRKRRFF